VEIESFLRRSNPVLDTDTPPADSPEGESIKARALTASQQSAKASNPTRRGRIAVLTIAAAAIVLLITLLPGQLGTQISKAAAALNQLASAAATQPSLGPGQFAYSEVEMQPTGVSAAGGAPPDKGWTQFSVGTVQTWIAPDGSGQQVTTTDLNPQFMTAADKAAWVQSGGRYQEPPKYVVTTQQFGPGGKGLSGNQFAGDRALPYDVSSLPTDATMLAKTLCDTRKWRTLPAATDLSIGYAISDTKNSGCQLFDIAVSLLQGPDVGSTPALRQALFRVLANVPGIRLMGRSTDALGQKGVRLQLVDRIPARSTKFTCVNGNGPDKGARKTLLVHRAATATTYTVIVDSSTGTLLSLERSFTPTKIDSDALDPCLPHAQSQLEEEIPDRSVLISSGVVNSTSAVAKGSVQECAVGSVPTFPWDTCNGARNDGNKQ
jgi:hypothetical protein